MHTVAVGVCLCVWQHLRSGTTGVAALICGQELTVAWLGDCQAILVRKGQVVTLMDPHKPDREVSIFHKCIKLAQQPLLLLAVLVSVFYL